MRSYMRAIMIFNKLGEVRSISMEPGVNIITGESKTGKSALVEIMDYCLCSSRCTIPKGKITEFAYIYVIPMVINKNTYIIARYNWESGGKMHISKEDIDFPIDKIDLDYFKNMPILSIKDAQYEIESALGLHVSNVVFEEDEKGKKASLRNMTSYLFQHQNLIASKFALFYRFSESYKRKDIIEQFPIFAGMIGQEYYSSLIELNDLNNQLNSKLKSQKSNQKSSEYLKSILKPLLEDYFSLLNTPVDLNINLSKMKKLASNLPEFDEAQLFEEDGIIKRYDLLKKELEELASEERSILMKINNLDDASNRGQSFTESLTELKEKTKAFEIGENKYSCPLCGNNCEVISEEDRLLLEAGEWLDRELEITSKYTHNFSEDIRKLNRIASDISEKMKSISNQIKEIEKKYIKSEDLNSKREKVNYAKAKIELYSNMIDVGLFKDIDEEIESLKDSISFLEDKIKGYDLDVKKSKAQTFLSDNMNRLALTLDFEEEYRPINLNFGLVDGTFDLYQYQNKYEKIFLNEMGSGANWVSCHISLFLSFLRYFTKQESSPMPLIMFFDQPSQVYFPEGDVDKNEFSQADLKAVNHMYKTIFDEIKSIGDDTGILPQILIVDHVDGKNLEVKDEFISYIRSNWRNGHALI
ncbi:DUF3732 domain-containing protein [Clostridium baratii]|uniref:DUF3732 domain-containing protein n=1 Tax=Clostridium baratii TaxID=1561 RepID=UPI0036F33343